MPAAAHILRASSDVGRVDYEAQCARWSVMSPRERLDFCSDVNLGYGYLQECLAAGNDRDVLLVFPAASFHREYTRNPRRIYRRHFCEINLKSMALTARSTYFMGKISSKLFGARDS